MSPHKSFVILLIDDDEDDREFFKLALSEIDMDIHCDMAGGATMAYSILENYNCLPHFIFLDLNMPAINGRNCLMQLKNNPKTAAIPVVIFSTSSEEHDIIETKALGAIHFMTKPTDLKQLTTDLNKFFIHQFQINNDHEK